MVQSAYRLIVQEDGGDRGTHTVWDTGWLQSDVQLGVEYGGKPLRSTTGYSWSVQIRDDVGEEAQSAVATFETSFLQEGDWVAKWIACVAKTPTVQSPLFRREFTLSERVVRGRIYVSGLGYHELWVNGVLVGDAVLDPAWTDYRSRIFYVTHDVTQLLRKGGNVVGVALGNGWFEPFPSPVASQLCPQFILEVRLDLADGSQQVIATDGSGEWKTTVDGPVVDHSIYGGTTYDARREIPGWAEPGVAHLSTGARWRSAIIVEAPGGRLQAQPLEPIKVVDVLTPAKVTRLSDTTHVVDFGQNFAGWVRIRLDAEPDAEISLRHAELLDDDGHVNTVNLRSAAATDRFIVSDDSPRWHEPKFTYHGFRYVQVEGALRSFGAEDILGQVVRSDVSKTGSFRSDHDLLNRLHQNIVWTEASNLHGLPTDCPQRDERLAWLNDMTVRAEEAVHNFNLARLYGKWFGDILDTQGAETGAIADTAPHVRFGHRPADPVSSSFLLVPWLLAMHYGETRWIERHYERLDAWVTYLASLREGGLILQSEIGDWAPPVEQAVAGSAGAGAVSAKTPGGLISTCFLFLNLELMAQFARTLDRSEHETDYLREADRVRQSINERYFDRHAGSYGSGNQSSNSIALYTGIVPTGYEDAVLDNLVRDIADHGYHLTTGNLCTKFVMDVLGRAGRTDVAMRLLEQRTYPSWGYMIDKGATTIWERWEHVTGGPLAAMASHNHPMYGAVDSWFYRFLGGISPTPDRAGFGHFLIEPQLAESVGSVECRLETVRGLVGSSWTVGSGATVFDIDIPANSTASILLPCPEKSTVLEGGRVIEVGPPTPLDGVRAARREDAGIRLEVGSGRYRFVVHKLKG